jgi:uncharacterized protein YcnI
MFEHTFAGDGSVTYKIEGSDKATRENHYEAARINDDVVTVSYLAKSGWTLTVVLDYKSKSAVGFASNDKEMVVQHGHFESVPLRAATS